ncbi:hypothetical protein GYMLUDRAFT_972691 [Collybiopsis luxurians FD-317 M1]|nr:hypothetical protein GYMLUDRAFT_972691 [Collybiopsis luxurians FD-317 M1]
MSTLQLIDTDKNIYELWSWAPSDVRDQKVILTDQQLSTRGNVVIGYLGPRDQESRVAVVAKLARQSSLHSLEKEYEMYETKLKRLQGHVVPRCYGLFKGINSNGEGMACLLLEYCIGSPTFALEDRNRLIMLAVCKLHNAGVLHGSLGDGRHIVYTNSQVRLVDFTHAIENHRCVGAIPMLTSSTGEKASRNGCPELVFMEEKYGMADLLSKYHTQFHSKPAVHHPRRGRF